MTLKNVLELTSSQEASHANLFPKKVNDEGRKITVISGQKCLELYESSSRHGSSLKMCVGYLLSSSAWYSNKCALTWKEKVTKYNRLLFQLAPSTPRTEETGSGLLRTPDANMDRGPGSEENLKERYLVKKQPLCLNDQLAMMEKGLIDTPSACMYKGSGSNQTVRNRTDYAVEKTPDGTKTGLKLQPLFVEHLMGYPLGWTSLSEK